MGIPQPPGTCHRIAAATATATATATAKAVLR